MTTEERRALLDRAITAYGAPAQMDMAVEEMAELTKALCKVKRVSCAAEAKAVLENVVEEMADVQIMLDQLRIIFGRSTAEAEEYKLERLKKRLDTATAAEASHRSRRPAPRSRSTAPRQRPRHTPAASPCSVHTTPSSR
jgi:NTP pyrophosphatase (non-canonical NTP hydrolase)